LEIKISARMKRKYLVMNYGKSVTEFREGDMHMFWFNKAT
jgi:hypothetical protein